MKIRGGYLLPVVISLAILTSVPAYAMVPVWNITNDKEYISDIAIAADGSRLITGTMTGIATVYDQNRNIVWKEQIPGILVVGYQGNGTTSIIGSRENIYSNKGVVRSYTNNGSHKWRVITGSVAALGIARKNNSIVVGNRMGDVLVLNEKGDVVAKFNDTPQTDVVSHISVSDNGEVFVYTLAETYPRIRFVTMNPQRKRAFVPISNASQTGYGAGEQITDIAISSDARYIISSYGEGNHGLLCLYASNGTKLWSKEMSEIKDIAILSNGASVYAGRADGYILGYSRSGNLLLNYSTGSPVTSLSLANNKNLLAAGDANGNLYLFNDIGNLLWTYRIEEFPVAEISQIEFSRNGVSMAVLVNNKNLYFFMNELKPVAVESQKIYETPTPLRIYVAESSPSIALIIFSLLLVVVLLRRK